MRSQQSIAGLLRTRDNKRGKLLRIGLSDFELDMVAGGKLRASAVVDCTEQWIRSARGSSPRSAQKCARYAAYPVRLEQHRP